MLTKYSLYSTSFRHGYSSYIGRYKKMKFHSKKKIPSCFRVNGIYHTFILKYITGTLLKVALTCSRMHCCPNNRHLFTLRLLVLHYADVTLIDNWAISLKVTTDFRWFLDSGSCFPTARNHLAFCVILSPYDLVTGDECSALPEDVKATALYFYKDLTQSQFFEQMAAQLSTKAALLLAKILATVSQY